MEAFSSLPATWAGSSPVTDEFPAQRPVTRSLDISLICSWINGWVNNRDAGDLRRYRAHYDVTVVIGRARKRLILPCFTEHATCTGFEFQSTQICKYVFLIRLCMISRNLILSVIPVYSYWPCGKFKSTRHISLHQLHNLLELCQLIRQLGKMAAVKQATFSDAFSWMQILYFD